MKFYSRKVKVYYFQRYYFIFRKYNITLIFFKYIYKIIYLQVVNNIILKHENTHFFS